MQRRSKAKETRMDDSASQGPLGKMMKRKIGLNRRGTIDAETYNRIPLCVYRVSAVQSATRPNWQLGQYYALDSVRQCGAMEIDQQSHFPSSQSELAQQRRMMHRLQSADCMR